MPKMTAKYRVALVVAHHLVLPAIDDQEQLYRALGDRGYFWDSKSQRWEENLEPADAPTDLVRVRVWTGTGSVRDTAYDIRGAMGGCGYELVDATEPYQCRPPKQLESRIYLTFRKRSPG